MPKLSKYNIENQVHFVTTTVHKEIWLLNKERFFRIIIDNLNFYRNKYLFKLIGYVIIPWHLHILLQLNAQYNNISRIMQFFKGHSARKIIAQLKAEDSLNLTAFKLRSSPPLWVAPEPLLGNTSRSRGSDLPARYKPNYRIWQPGFYDFNIYTEDKLT